MFMLGATKKAAMLISIGFFAAAPSSTNFTLKSYDIGTGGATSSSTNYGLNSQTGEQSGDPANSTNYKVTSGLQNTQNANVPLAPTFTNPSSEYNRLNIVINTASNPTDTKYQIAISSDNFVTTQYVQTDNTVGTTNTVGQYQTYASWGGATGVWIVGLTSNTTYQTKVRALQGNYTGSPFGPIASAATVSSSITFTVATSLTGTPPFAIGFSSLAAGSVVNSTSTADIGLSTNSMNGGVIYVKSNGSLSSALAGTSITSVSADLDIAATGYGAQVSAVGQSSGGPFAATSPYNGVTNNVGALNSSLQGIVSTPTRITSGTASVILKAKAGSTTPSATDYSDTLTFIAAMLY